MWHNFHHPTSVCLSHLEVNRACLVSSFAMFTCFSRASVACLLLTAYSISLQLVLGEMDQLCNLVTFLFLQCSVVLALELLS